MCQNGRIPSCLHCSTDRAVRARTTSRETCKGGELQMKKHDFWFWLSVYSAVAGTAAAVLAIASILQKIGGVR